MYIDIYMYMCVCVCDTDTHTLTHTNTHTHTHTCAVGNSLSLPLYLPLSLPLACSIFPLAARLDTTTMPTLPGYISGESCAMLELCRDSDGEFRPESVAERKENNSKILSVCTGRPGADSDSDCLICASSLDRGSKKDSFKTQHRKWCSKLYYL